MIKTAKTAALRKVSILRVAVALTLMLCWRSADGVRRRRSSQGDGEGEGEQVSNRHQKPDGVHSVGADGVIPTFRAWLGPVE